MGDVTETDAWSDGVDISLDAWTKLSWLQNFQQNTVLQQNFGRPLSTRLVVLKNPAPFTPQTLPKEFRSWSASKFGTLPHSELGSSVIVSLTLHSQSILPFVCCQKALHVGHTLLALPSLHFWDFCVRLQNQIVKPSPVETRCLQVAAAAHCGSERAVAACCEPMTHNQWQPELSH